MNKTKLVSAIALCGMVLSPISVLAMEAKEASKDEMVFVTEPAVMKSSEQLDPFVEVAEPQKISDTVADGPVKTEKPPVTTSSANSDNINLGSGGSTVPITTQAPLVEEPPVTTEPSNDGTGKQLGNHSNTVPPVTTQAPSVEEPPATTEPPSDGTGKQLGNQTEPTTTVTTTVSSVTTDAPKTTEPTVTKPTVPSVTTQARFEAPVKTKTGAIVIGTQKGNVITQNEDGTTQIQTADSVGGKVQKDGQVLLETATGEKKLLPHTGAKENFVLVVLGVFLLLILGYGKFKEEIHELLKKFKK